MADRTVSVDFVARTAGFTSGVQSMQRDVHGFSQSIAQTARQNEQQWRQMGRAAMVAGGVMAAGLGAAVMQFQGFEREMNRVGALTGATGEQFDALSGLAQELGRTTVFTASQSADALGFLAMAGFDANTAMEALPETLTLAAAAGMDLARAADITTNILTGYGMATDELAHANDVLTATFTSSNTSMEQLGDAMAYAAPVASAAGVEFEEAAAAIGLMGNAGIQGGRAGTSLRGAMTRLLNPTGQVADTLARLGVEATDSSGELVGLEDIVRQLGDSGATTGDLMQIFGQRAGPAMAALLSQGADELGRFTQDLRESGGIAEEIAERQMSGLTGSLVRFRSAMEGAAIALGGGLAPAIGAFADVATVAVAAFAALPAPVQTFIATAGAATAGTLLLTGAFLRFAPAVMRTVTAVTSLATLIAGKAAIGLAVLPGLLNPVGIALAAAAVAAAGLGVALSRMGDDQQTAGQAAEQLAGSLGMAYEDLSGSLAGAAEEASAAGQSFVNANAEVIAQLRELDAAAARDLLFRIGFDLVQHGADPDEAMEAVERLRAAAGVGITLDFDASSLTELDTLSVAASRNIERLADDVGAFSNGIPALVAEMSAVGEATAAAFAAEPVNNFVSAVTALHGAEQQIRDLGLGGHATKEALDGLFGTFIDTTGIVGFEGNIRSVNELMGQLADGTAIATPEVRHLAEVFNAGTNNGLGFEEAMSYVLSAALLMGAGTSDAADGVNELAHAAAMAEDPTGELAEELGLVGEQALDAASALDTYLDSVRRATDPVYALSAALNDVESAQDAYTEAVKEYGAGSSEAQQAALGIAQALDAAEAAAINGELSFEAFNARLEGWVASGQMTRAEADAISERVGFLTGEMENYTGGYEAHLMANPDQALAALGELWGAFNRLPEEVQTDLLAADSASDVAAALGDRYGELPDEVRAYLEATDNAEPVIAFVQGSIEGVPTDWTTTLTAVDAATSIIDRVRNQIRSLPTEHVVRIRASGHQVAGVTGMGGHTVRHTGGPADGTGPFHAGALRHDEVPIVALRDEYIVNPESSRKHRALLEAINADRYHFGGVVGAAASGPSSLALGGDLASLVAAIERVAREMDRTAKQQQVAGMRTAVLDARKEARTADTPEARKRAREQEAEASQRYAEFLAREAQEHRKLQLEIRKARVEAELRIATNRESWQFDRMSTRDQLRNLERRLGAERFFNDEWMQLDSQRQQILDRQAAEARTRYDQLLDQLSTALDRELDLRATAADRTADMLERRAAELSASLSLDFGDDAWDWQASTILDQMGRHETQIADWQAALDEALDRGLDRDAIELLGLDRSPEALGQLKVLLRSTDDELAAISQATGRRQRSIADAVAAERLDGQSQLGRELLEVERQLGEDLAEIGQDTGRSYTDAIAAAMASGIPGIVAVADQLQAALRDVQQAERAAAAPAPGQMSRADQIRQVWTDAGVSLAFGSESAEQRLARLVASGRSIADLRRSAQIQAIQHPATRLHDGGLINLPPDQERIAVLRGQEVVQDVSEVYGRQPAQAQVVVVETIREVIPDGTVVEMHSNLGEVVRGTIRTEQASHDGRLNRTSSVKSRQKVRA